MSTTTHRIAIAADAYTNVSNGNANCALVNGNSHVRLLVGSGDEEPDAETIDYAAVGSSGVVSIENLEAEADLWVRAEAGEASVTVIRGPARVILASG